MSETARIVELMRVHRCSYLTAQKMERDARAAMDSHADADCERERCTHDDAARRDERIERMGM